MSTTYRVPDLESYRMNYREPHLVLEPAEREISVVADALRVLVEAGILPHARYDEEKMLAFREAVRDAFEIPWTAITPRMQRLLYAINAVAQPKVMVAVGVFCGNTFISNAGAGVGPGACYEAERLVGLEIRPEEAERARRNVAAIDPGGRAEVLAADGLEWLRAFEGRIDLLYLDADGGRGKGKSIYLDMLEAAGEALGEGSLVLAHNAGNAADQMTDYLARARDPKRFRASRLMLVDGEGLEVSLV
jgi:predicted O-methyltransferase YrrM